MKKILFLFAICFMAVGCEKDVIGESYPEMEGFYIESCGLPAVTIDSVKLFSTKVNDYTTEYPESKEHSLYPKIQANIKSASLRITITADPTWAGDTIIYF
jgi:hypothetical protein